MASFLLGDLTTFNQASGSSSTTAATSTASTRRTAGRSTGASHSTTACATSLTFPWHEIQNRMGGFSPTAFAAGQHSAVYPNAPIGLLFAGDAGFNPIGVTPTSPTSCRASASRSMSSEMVRRPSAEALACSMNPGPSGVFNNIFSNNSPFVTAVGITYPNNAPGNFTNPYAGITNPFPAQQPPPPTAPIPTQPYISFDPV